MIKKQFIIYFLIGVFHNVLFLVSYYYFTTHLYIDPTIFILLSYPLFIFIPFYLNGKYTFHVGIDLRKYFKFFITYALILIGNVFFLELFFRYLKFDHNYTQIVFTILSSIISFIISKNFIFNKTKS